MDLIFCTIRVFASQPVASMLTISQITNFAIIVVSRIFAISFAMARTNGRSDCRQQSRGHSHGKRAGRTITFTVETIFADASRDGPMRWRGKSNDVGNRCKNCYFRRLQADALLSLNFYK